MDFLLAREMHAEAIVLSLFFFLSPGLQTGKRLGVTVPKDREAGSWKELTFLITLGAAKQGLD